MGNKETEIKAFCKEDFTAGDRVVLYGAAMYGALALNALNEIGIPVTNFCDRVQAGTTFQGKAVLSPDTLQDKRQGTAIIETEDKAAGIEQAAANGRTIVLVCATKGMRGICKYLHDIHHQHYYHIGELLNYVNYNTLEAGYRELAKEELIEKYMFYLQDTREVCQDRLELPFVALSITERCNLRCAKCSVLAPYYKSPGNDSYEEIIVPLQRFLNCVDDIKELQIGGGEPFIHPHLDDILDWCIKQEKIKEISIFTNSTILPESRLLSRLKNGKVKMLLDDYGPLSKKFDEWIRLCEEEKIRYVIQRFARWDDLGDFQVADSHEKIVEERFSCCSFGNVNSFLKGKLQRCTTAARIMDIGLIEDNPDDYIDFNQEKDRNIFRQEIREMLFERKYHRGCFLCRGISNSELGIPVAQQMDKSVVYGRRE